MAGAIEAIREGRFSRRTLFKLGETGALTIAGLLLMAEKAKAAEILTPNDWRNFTYLVQPSPWEVAIDHGNFWDFGSKNTENGLRQLYFQVVLGQISAKTYEGLDVPVIRPTSPLPDGQWIELSEKLPRNDEGRDRARKLYGIKGTRSDDLDAWEIDELGQATLKERGDGNLTPVNVNGAVVETWANSKSGARNLLLHPGVSTYKIPSGTFWRFTSDLGVRQLVRQQMEKGLSSYVLHPVRGAWKQLGLAHMFASKQELVENFGVEGTRSASFDKPGDPVWDINTDGGATLWPDPKGNLTRVKHSNAIIEVRAS